MIIQHDRSYIYPSAQKLIEQGYATEERNTLFFSYRYTEEDMAKDREWHEQCTPEQWEDYRIQKVIERNDTIHAVMEAISKEFVCYQYGENDRQRTSYGNVDWDLFFWCSSFNSTAGDPRLTGRDYSDTRLSFNSRHDAERQQQIYDRVLAIIDEQFSDQPNLHLRVQYKARVDETKMSAAVKEILPQMLGKSWHYRGMTGKIVQTERGIFFKKKYAKHRAYRLSNHVLLQLWWAYTESTDGTEMCHA